MPEQSSSNELADHAHTVTAVDEVSSPGPRLDTDVEASGSGQPDTSVPTDLAMPALAPSHEPGAGLADDPEPGDFDESEQTDPSIDRPLARSDTETSVDLADDADPVMDLGSVDLAPARSSRPSLSGINRASIELQSMDIDFVEEEPTEVPAGIMDTPVQQPAPPLPPARPVPPPTPPRPAARPAEQPAPPVPNRQPSPPAPAKRRPSPPVERSSPGIATPPPVARSSPGIATPPPVARSSPAITPPPAPSSPDSLPVTGDDGIEPSPEYIAAREAALRAVRASKAVQAVTPPPGYDPPVKERALERSYTQALAAIGFDDEDDAAVSGEIPAQGSSPGHVPGPMPPGSQPAIAPPYHATGEMPPAAPYPAPAPTGSALAGMYGDDEDEMTGAMPLAARVVAPEATSSWGPNPAYARKRHRHKGPIPGYTGEALPREKNPVRMAIGGLVMALGLFLLLWYLPEHAPALDAATGTKKVSSGFTPALYLRGQLAAAGFLLVGLLFVLNGLWFKPRAEVVCTRCKRYVIARRDGVFLKCPRSSHTARTCKTTLFLLALLIIAIGTTLLTIAMGSIVRAG